MTKKLLPLLTIAAGIPLFAQSHLYTADVPFDFTAGKISFPAGKYTIKVDVGSGVLALQSSDWRHNMFALTTPVSSRDAAAPHLTFHRYGDSYFLSEVWGPETGGRRLSTSAAEREQMARTRPSGPVSVRAAIGRR